MTPKPQNLCSGLAGVKRARLAFLPLALVALLGKAGAAEKEYQYFRFQATRMQEGATRISLSEFNFSYNGTALNLKWTGALAGDPGQNGTSTNIVPVSATYGAQATSSGNHPNRIWDGKPSPINATSTRWYSPDLADPPLSTPLDISFQAKVKVDAYNFATSADSSSNSVTPVSWSIYGRNSTTADWELIDVRSNAVTTFTSNTYQAGFTFPATITPVINYFRLGDTATLGSQAIVRNSDTNGVKLEWDASLGTTTVSPPGSTVPLTGSGTYDPPDNATSTYTFAAVSGASNVTRTVQVRSVAGGFSTFRYLRFKATKLRNGTATGLVQLAEFGFQNNGNAVAISSVTNPGGNNPVNEEVDKVIDGLTTTKWLDTTNGYLIFDLGEPNPPLDENRVTDYSFITANDATDRDPLQWTLEGSNDQTAWTLIENVNFDYPTTLTRFTSTRSIPLPGASLPPSVAFFNTDAAMVYAGTPVKLSWSTNGAATITIDNGVGTVAAQGELTVTPTDTITYALSASTTGNTVTTTKTITVTVLPGPAPVGIDLADFSGTVPMSLRGTSTFVSGRLQLTPDIGSQQGEAWHIVKQAVGGGFEATFGLSMTHAAGQPADGVSFIVQNHPQGSNAPSTGETGVTTNALNICFITYGGTAADASKIQVRNGTTILQTAFASSTAGITYKGITGYAYPTMTGMPGAEPFRIRVVYTPGDGTLTESLLDVYVNEVAVIENLMVDLTDIGAVDAEGKAFVGFAGRTGGLSQLNQITYFRMRFGDFSALPPFGIVKSFRNTMVAGAPTWDIVWDSDFDNNYVVQTSDNLVDWEDVGSYLGEDGQIGHRFSILNTEPQRFYRVVEEVLGQ